MNTLHKHVIKKEVSGILLNISTGTTVIAKYNRESGIIDMAKALQKFNDVLVELMNHEMYAILTPIKSKDVIELDVPFTIMPNNGKIAPTDRAYDNDLFWTKIIKCFQASTLFELETEESLFYIKVAVDEGWTEIDLAEFNLTSTIKTIEISSNQKASNPATYKQYQFLKELMVHPDDELPAVSRFTKKLDRGVASEAIQHKLDGNIVKIKI